MGLSPEEAAFLGGSATLSTHVDGKPTRRLWFNIFAQGLATSSPFFTIGAFLALLVRLRSDILNEPAGSILWLTLAMLSLGAAAFVAPVAWGLREETVELRPDVLRVRTGKAQQEIRWSAVKELRATMTISYVSRRIVNSRPGIIVRTGTGEYAMKWWRFPMEAQKQFFNFAASKVLPNNTPVIDDLHWLTADKAANLNVRSEWGRQYKLTVKAGLVLMVVGLAFFPGFLIGAPLVGAIGTAIMFMGLFSAFVAWAALSEEKKKRERDLGDG